jgi:LPS export ABC transporter permease LptF
MLSLQRELRDNTVACKAAALVSSICDHARATAMKLLDRYVGKQILTTAFFAVLVLSIILVVGNLFKLIDVLTNHSVPIQYVATVMAYVLPFSLTFTIPWGFLTAVLLVFGKMSAENELIALRSSGVSIPRVCAAMFGWAVLSVAICLWINVDIAPRAQEKMKQAVFDIATSNPIAMFGSDQVIDEFPGRKIYVEKKEGTELEGILMYELNDDGEPLRVVHAHRGQLQADIQGKQQIMLRLFDARYEQRDPDEPTNLMKVRSGITAEKIDLPISLTELYEKNKKRRGFSQMTLAELAQQQTKEQRTAARVEINKRFSVSFAPFAFALLAVPLAITAHRRETSIGFLFSLVIAFVYFFFIIVASDTLRNNSKAHPELLIWLPNVLFIGLGSWLFWRLSRK